MTKLLPRNSERCYSRIIASQKKSNKVINILIIVLSLFVMTITPVNGKEFNSSYLYNKIGKPYSINGVTYTPKFEDTSYVEYGKASWYGPGFHGRKTATGEIFDQEELTAAHRTLQLPCIIRVTNLENNKSIIVKVNDRGPFSDNRIIDLSAHAAELLKFKRKGVVKVKIEVIKKEQMKIANEDQ